jgi:hypothetical protein
VFAPQRDNKNMKRGYLLQERHSASQPRRQKLPLRFLMGPGDEMSREGFFRGRRRVVSRSMSLFSSSSVRCWRTCTIRKLIGKRSEAAGQNAH